jgi:hypothetical protein
MPCSSATRPRPESALPLSSVAHIFLGSLESEFYSNTDSIFSSSCPKIAFFSMVAMRMDVTSGSKALGESNLTIKMRRLAHLLMQVALCIRVKGMVAYSAAPFAGAPHNNGWLTAHASLQIEPQFCDYAALAMVVSADFQSGGQSVHKLTNDVLLDIEELLGSASKSAAPLMGKHSAMPCAAYDDCKFDRTYIVNLNFFFTSMSGFAMPSSVIGYHTADIVVELAALDSVLCLPTAAQGDVAGTSSALIVVLASPATGSFSMFVRPDAAWGSCVPTEPLTNDSVIADVYVMANYVHVGASEAAQILKKTYSQPILKQAEVVARVTRTQAPSADLQEEEVKIVTRKPVAFFTVHARQGGAQFSKLHAGFHSEAPTRAVRIVKAYKGMIDDQPFVHAYADEGSPLHQLWFAGTQTPMHILFHSFCMSAAESCPNGSLGLGKASDVYLYFDIAKEAFAGGNQVVELTVSLFYWAKATYRSGMIKMTG